MNEEDLKRLIEKYYNGESTDEEERSTERLFQQKQCTSRAMKLKRKYSALYGFSTEIPEPSADFEAQDHEGY